MRRYTVVLDGEKVGKIAETEWISIRTDPGQHELEVRMDWARSPKLMLDLADRQTIGVELWANANPLLWPYWMTFGCRRFIKLDLITDDSAAADFG